MTLVMTKPRRKRARGRKTKADLETENRWLRIQADRAKALVALLDAHRVDAGTLAADLMRAIRDFSR